MCFTEPEWKFRNDKYYEASNLHSLPKISDYRIRYKHLKQ